METTPIYIKNLQLKNIRTFGDVELNFELKDGTLPQWTIILGDNGIGKSTLLQCVGWMKPLFIYEKDNEISNYVPGPFITDEQNDRFIGLVRKNGEAYKEGSKIAAIFQSNKDLKSAMISTKSDVCQTSIEIDINENEQLLDLRFGLDTTKGNNFYNNEVLIYAYSASRTLGKINIAEADLEDMIPGFIDERTVLYDAQQILHTINYASLGAKGAEKKRYEDYFIKVKKMLISLLPEVKDIDDIYVPTPRLVNNRIKEGEVLITTKHGKKIPLSDFSLGYKTAISWSVDLSWRLFNKYPESPNALEEPAIVIIDELDLHLHPKWQTEIIESLSNHFPKIQFVVTAHSPLMVQPSININYAVLKFARNCVEIINEPVDIDGWRFDQILTSEFFGLKSARGLYGNLLEKRSALIAKENLTNKDKKELQVITEQLSQFPSGENPEQIEERKIIRKIISEFRKTGKSIKI